MTFCSKALLSEWQCSKALLSEWPNIKHSSWGILLRTKLKFACKLLNIILVCVFSYKFTCCRQLFSIPIFPSFYDSSSLANLCKSDRSPIKMIFKLLKSLSQIIERLCSISFISLFEELTGELRGNTSRKFPSKK